MKNQINIYVKNSKSNVSKYSQTLSVMACFFLVYKFEKKVDVDVSKYEDELMKKKVISDIGQP